jgi:hypothetical protein
VAVDDLGGSPGHRDVGEQCHHQARADRRPVNRRNHRLVEIDHVEHQIAGLAHDAQPVAEFTHGLVDQVEAAPGGERFAFAADQDDARIRVATDRRPDVGEIAVHLRPDRIEPGSIENDVQHAVVGAFES